MSSLKEPPDHIVSCWAYVCQLGILNFLGSYGEGLFT